MRLSLITFGSSLLFTTLLGSAADPQESDYWQIQQVPNPDGHVLEVGALELAPDGRVFAATRRGEIFTLTDALGSDIATTTLTLFAQGLHECLGLAWRDNSLYTVQRPEVTRLSDDDGDGRADTFETISDRWGISGDYHEYAFGSRFDKHGDLWVALCLTGSYTSEAPYRGWALRISPSGKTVPCVSGVRSPGGVGFNAEGDVFMTDNNGPWNGSSSLKWLKPGSFQGHPDGNVWFRLNKSNEAGERPENPVDNSRMAAERLRLPSLVPPAVMLPHSRVGQSPTGIVCDTTGGKFGPFENQLFIGEQCYSNIERVCLEKVNGVYQGAVFPFLGGFDSGLIGMLLTPDGKMFTGGSDRGWGSRGGKPYCLDRVVWTGRTPFEIRTMNAAPDGFTLTFTEPVNPDTFSAKAESCEMEAFTWLFREEYGSMEVDKLKPVITAVTLSADGLRAALKISPLTKGHVHYLKLPGVRSAKGLPLLHPEAYFTLNEIPAS